MHRHTPLHVVIACLAAAAPALIACMDVSTGTGSGGGSSGADSGAAAAKGEGGAVTTPAVTGTNCGADSNLGIQLCASTTQCPSVVVDQSVFPGCGWRIVNGTADLQCDCNGMMCPIGTPSSCGDAAMLLSTQTQGTVCQGIADGRCTTPGGSTGGTGSSGSGGGNCDKNCAADCNGNASCLMLCGC